MIGWMWRVIVGRFTPCEHEWVMLNEGELLRRGSDVCCGYFRNWECAKCKVSKVNRW